MSGISSDASLRAPFPWAGGKRRIAPRVWALLGGDVGRYVEPFAGSLGVLLGRPGGAPARGMEIVNDLDGHIVNVWRALKYDPEATIRHADGIRTEFDLTARHLWLVNEGRELLRAKLQTDPEWFDARAAGWWLYGVALWIGDGFANGTGPWTRKRITGGGGDDGRGVLRKLPHNGNRGVHRGNEETGAIASAVYELGERLSARLTRVLITNGDWQRCLTSAVTDSAGGASGVYLDPPYAGHGETYAEPGDTAELWCRLEAWAATAPADLRIVVSGYDGNFAAPPGWGCQSYTAKGTSSANRTRERLWYSPACHQPSLFGDEETAA